MFKGLTERRLYKSFGVKGLKRVRDVTSRFYIKPEFIRLGGVQNQIRSTYTVDRTNLTQNNTDNIV
jgi:hypothetical protein